VSTKRRFSAADWITLGHKALSAGGAEAIKLDAICKAAGLTRGSFYHHFTDHTAFLTVLAAAWAAQNTSRLVASLEGVEDADAQHLNDMALDLDFALEVGIRELARRVPQVAAIVEEADAGRLSVLTDLARARFRLSDRAAADLAFIEYAAFCGMTLIRPQLDRKTLLRLSRTLDGLMRRHADDACGGSAPGAGQELAQDQ
jgi:AcrR family transcriptional regulator